jgi:hypothetical protein
VKQGDSNESRVPGKRRMTKRRLIRPGGPRGRSGGDLVLVRWTAWAVMAGVLLFVAWVVWRLAVHEPSQWPFDSGGMD